LSVDVADLYRKYGPMVFRRCYSLLKDEALAEDAVQDVFLRVLARRETLRPDYPSSLLYRIATNVSLNALRSRRRSRMTGDPDLLDSIASSEDLAGSAVARGLLDFIFRTDSSDPTRTSTRTIAVLHYVDGLTLEETAEIAGMSVSGVRKRLRVLKDRVRAEGESLR